ncbi:MAG: TAXI family TRAP transporter solute-binding subunit [Pseudomonadota bacterium]
MPRWFLALAGWCLSADVLAALTLGIHSDEPAPSLGKLLAERLPAAFDIQLRPFDDVASITAALASGELDLAFLEEPLEPTPGVTTISELYPAALHILIDEDHGADNIGQVLAAGPVWAGTPGGIGYTLAMHLATDYGTPAPQLLDDPWSTVPSVYFIFGGLLPQDALQRLDGYRLYSIGDPDGNIAASIARGVALRYPNLRPFVFPAELYPSLSKAPALTLAVPTLLVGRESLDTELVYDLAQTLDHLAPEIASVYPLAGVEDVHHAPNAPRALPWHQGARRYRDRELPTLVERYAEFVGASVTVALAVISLGIAFYRRRRQARKDRLDTYYQQALACRQHLRDGEQPGRIAERLRALQEEVFELLIAERIDADSALIAFLNLSNQLLLETSGLQPEVVKR